MAIQRRRFIQSGIAGLSLLGFSNLGLNIPSKGSRSKPFNKPIVISTWDFGIPANLAAWDILKNGGRALDAVEQGVKIPEADLKNSTVGKGGYPDRDGHVTLDACIMDELGNCGSVAALEISHMLFRSRGWLWKKLHT